MDVVPVTAPACVPRSTHGGRWNDQQAMVLTLNRALYRYLTWLFQHGFSVVLQTATHSSSQRGGCSDRDHTQHDRSGPQERGIGAILDQEAPL